METILPHEQIKFFLKILLNYILKTRVSYDKAFKTIVNRYEFPKWFKPSLYKIGYYTVNYYYSLKWLSSKHGYGVKTSGLINYFSSVGFSIRKILSSIRSESQGLSSYRRISLTYSYPEFLVKDLLKYVEINEIERILSSLNKRKKWLRINLLKTSIENALKCLDETGIVYEKSFIEYVYRLKKPIWRPLSRNKCISNGYVVLQDISSVLSIEIIKNYLYENILDACSSPGLKLSLIHMLSGSYLFSTAVDYSWKRIVFEKKLLGKLGIDLSKVFFINSDSTIVSFNRLFKLAVVDAPCSGLGSVYSDPAVKLNTQSSSKIKYYSERQYSILKNILKYSERVLYITCSIHPDEGENVIERIVYENLAEPIEINSEYTRYLSKSYPGFTISNKTYRINPYQVNGQGFFIALLESRVVGK
ncbi:MAG: RsmB/NOP family class I SAM-dependent RNA methyltransferase [Desulfurococcaceae archaeon]